MLPNLLIAIGFLHPFAGDAKRVEYLFEVSEKYTSGLLAGASAKAAGALRTNPKRARS